MKKSPSCFLRPSFFGASVFLFSLVLAVNATQMTPLSLEELTDHSEVIMRGKVSSKTCLRDDSGRIITRIQLEVEEVWKGEAIGKTFTIIQAGGVLGGQRTIVVGQATFAIGEEAVVFLALNARGEGVVLGVCQGKFEIFQDASGNRQVRNFFHGGAPGGGGSAQALQNKINNHRLTLADLKRRVAARKK